MKIIRDTREQKPLEGFEEYHTVSRVVKEGLSYGDYVAEFNDGTRSSTYFERKRMGDLFGTMGKGYKRFKKEMDRAKKDGSKLILIIEGSLTKVLKGHKRSQIKGYSLVMKLFTLWMRYDLLPVFCKDRPEMTRFIVEYYNAEGREKLIKERK